MRRGVQSGPGQRAGEWQGRKRQSPSRGAVNGKGYIWQREGLQEGGGAAHRPRGALPRVGGLRGPEGPGRGRAAEGGRGRGGGPSPSAPGPPRIPSGGIGTRQSGGVGRPPGRASWRPSPRPWWEDRGEQPRRDMEQGGQGGGWQERDEVEAEGQGGSSRREGRGQGAGKGARG